MVEGMDDATDVKALTAAELNTTYDVIVVAVTFMKPGPCI